MKLENEINRLVGIKKSQVEHFLTRIRLDTNLLFQVKAIGCSFDYEEPSVNLNGISCQVI